MTFVNTFLKACIVFLMAGLPTVCVGGSPVADSDYELQSVVEDDLADMIERMAPHDIALTEMACRYGWIRLKGFAPTNAAISRFMRVLIQDRFHWYPELQTINVRPSRPVYKSDFVLWIKPKRQPGKRETAVCISLHRAYPDPSMHE